MIRKYRSSSFATLCVSFLLASFAVPSYAKSETDGSEPHQLIFPIVHSEFIDGLTNLQTTFSFMNLSNTTASASIVAFQNDGTPTRILGLCDPFGRPPDLEEVQRDFEVPAQGGQDFLTQADNQSNLPGFAGWARVTLDLDVDVRSSSEVLLRASPEPCIVLSGTSPLSQSDVRLQDSDVSGLFLKAVEVSAVKPARQFRARGFDWVTRQSAFALVNPSETETASVQIEVFNYGAERIGAAEVTIPPLNRVARLMSELVQVLPCPECPPVHHRGFVRFSSDIPIAVGGVVIVKPGDIWVSLPVVPVD